MRPSRFETVPTRLSAKRAVRQRLTKSRQRKQSATISRIRYLWLSPKNKREKVELSPFRLAKFNYRLLATGVWSGLPRVRGFRIRTATALLQQQPVIG